MNPTRDEILRELIVQTIRGILVSDPVLIKSLLKYDEEKDFSDPLSIPTRGFVEYLISSGGGGGSGVTYRVFLIPSGTDASNGISLVGRTNEDGDQLIPDKAVWSVYDGDSSSSQAYNKNTKTVTGLETDDNGLTVNEVEVVLIGGEAVVPTSLTLQNITDRNINYSINGGSFSTLLINDSLNLNSGDSIILALETSSSTVYQLSNQLGSLINTDGDYFIENTPREWEIPLNSTELIITQPA